MCVIIVRQPGIQLPFDKLKTACKVNNHGWGLAIVDRGKIELRKELHDYGNDPDAIAEALDDAKDQLLMLHLRYVTVGEKSLDNCHPFQILNNKDDGTDLVMAHNGTLYMYRNPDDGASDTKHFAEQFVAPLLARTVRFTGPEHLLKDPFALKLLNKEINQSSVVTFLDGLGNHATINQNNGKAFDGWWASNEYSFEADHREPAKSTTTTHSCAFEGYSDIDYDGDPPWWDDHDKHKSTTTTSSTSNSTATIILPKQDIDSDIDYVDYAEDAKRIKTALDMTQKSPSAVLIRKMLDTKRTTFCELTGITSLKEMVRFDPEDLSEFVSFYPEISVVLLQDLLYELYLKDHKPTINTVVSAPTPKPVTQAANTNAETTNVATAS